QRCITPAVHQLDSRPMVVAQRLAPLHQSHQEREQLPPSLGQAALVARSLSGIARGTAVDEANVVQLLEPARHHRRAQPGAARELVEPRAAVEQLAEHQHRRARAAQLQRPLDAAPAFRVPRVARRERALALQYVGGLLSVGHVIHPTSDFAFPKPEAYGSGYGFPKPDAREGPPMTSAYLIDAVRTPVAKGKPGGAYSDIHPVDLHAHTLAALVERVGLDPVEVDDVISGAVGQIAEQSGNTARWALLGAGFPESVPGVTVDRQCGSSQQALHFAAQGVIAGAYDVAIASGVESMSRIPIGTQFQGKDFAGSRVGKRYDNGLIPQGISAELIAQRWNLSRTELDEFAVESHQRAAKAWKDGLFDSQITRVTDLAIDETIRPDSTVETLAGLRPAFRADHWVERYPDLEWRVTAGNSSPVNDGSAAVLVAGD